MKILQYIYYFFRSLYYRGMVNTFKLLYYEKKFEKKLGINTHSIVNLSNLTLAGENSEQNHHYQGASYFILFSVFSKIPSEMKAYPLIDFGCGKGRALFVAEQCGFKHSIGVDIAQELIIQAKNNLTKYSKKFPESVIDFQFNDATKFIIPHNASVFYFFNPFGESIMERVIQNILQSIKLNPRPVLCIYLNPKHKEVFERNGFKIFHIEKNKRYLEGIIYSL